MRSLHPRAAAVGASLVAALALLNLLGWCLRSTALTGVSADFVPMAATTALGLLGFAAILLVDSGRPKAFTRLVVLVPLGLAAYTLAGGFEASHSRLVGMSAATACTFLVLGLAVVSPSRALSVAASIGVCAFGVMVVLGYLYSQPIFTGTQIIPISLPAGIGLVILGAAFTISRGPDAPFIRHFCGPSVRSRLLRAFVPASAGLVIVMRIVTRYAQAHYTGNPVWLFAFLAVGCAALMAATVGLVSTQLAQKLEAAEAARVQAVAASVRAEGLTRETQLSKLAAIGNLVGGVAHEINNPLGVVRSNLQFLEEQLIGQPELASICVESRLAADRILDVTRELQQCAPLAVTNVTVPDVGAEVGRALDALPAGALGEVRVVREFAQTAAVSCDAQLFDRVVQTLVRNAAEATARSGRRAEIHVRLRQEGKFVQLEVDDNGDGVSAEVATRIFDPFLAIKPSGVGRGLSLAGAQALVRAAGGTLSVKPLPSGGARFAVTLPAVDSAEPQPQHADGILAARPEHAPGLVRRGRVLVVDDERWVASAIHRILRREHDVVCVDSGALALARITSGAFFDVILCDLLMPKMSGSELHEKVLEAAPAQAKQMIFFSGSPATPAIRDFLKKVKSHQLMDKPWDAEELRRLVGGRVQQAVAL